MEHKNWQRKKEIDLTDKSIEELNLMLEKTEEEIEEFTTKTEELKLLAYQIRMELNKRS